MSLNRGPLRDCESFTDHRRHVSSSIGDWSDMRPPEGEVLLQQRGQLLLVNHEGGGLVQPGGGQQEQEAAGGGHGVAAAGGGTALVSRGSQ